MTVHPPAAASLNLDGPWRLRHVGGPVPDGWSAGPIRAEVPGSVHTDLMAAGLIPDPYLDNNEARLEWIGLCDWEYSREFDWIPYEGAVASLRFDGLDTIAQISLNGSVIGSTRNMHRRYMFDVSDSLTEGRNVLTVIFSSAIKYADAASLELGYRPHVNHHPYNAIRKMACSFGWDWGIDTATAGIWKSVSLEHSAQARLSNVRLATKVHHGSGEVTINAVLNGPVARDAFLDCSIDGVQERVIVPAGTRSAQATVSVSNPELWWPAGYGDQRMYDVSVRLCVDDVTVDERTNRVGFRTVTADTTPDEHGTPFTLVVNGTAILVKGANWIPDDAFLHRVDRARYRARLDQARFANINLLRVWGGGIYEKDEFFEVCDELGILTWQDFLFACAAYSEAPALADEIEAEARDNVRGSLTTHRWLSSTAT